MLRKAESVLECKELVKDLTFIAEAIEPHSLITAQEMRTHLEKAEQQMKVSQFRVASHLMLAAHAGWEFLAGIAGSRSVPHAEAIEKAFEKMNVIDHLVLGAFDLHG